MIYAQRFWPETPDYVPQIYGYGRVSHSSQFERGTSTADQEARIKAYVELRKLDDNSPFAKANWAGMFSEPSAQSAFSKHFHQRPTGSELYRLLKPNDHIIVDKLDRLVRDTYDFLSLDRHFSERGIRLHIVNMAGGSLDTGTALGRFMLVNFALHAEFDSLIKGERVREARARMRARKTDAGVAVPPFIRLEGLPPGKTRGCGSKRVFQVWALDVLQEIVALRKSGMGYKNIHKQLRGRDYLRYINPQEFDRWYHFYLGWLDLGCPDLNEIKISEVILRNRLKEKLNGAQS